MDTGVVDVGSQHEHTDAIERAASMAFSPPEHAEPSEGADSSAISNEESSRGSGYVGADAHQSGLEPNLEQQTPPEIDMAQIDDACQSVVQETDGGIACGVVDLDTGMLLGVFNKANYSQSLNEIVAASCIDMFRGTSVTRVSQAVRQHRGVPEDGEHYFEEILVTSKHNYHFMKTIRGGKAVMVLVTDKSANSGMGWAVLKSMISKVEPLVP